MRRWIRVSDVFWGRPSDAELAGAVDDLIRRHGTVNGVVERMERMGLGSVADSWIGSNVREPIFSDQLHTLFGTGVLRAMAAKLDLQPRDLVRQLSQALPRAIHQMAASTPCANAMQ